MRCPGSIQLARKLGIGFTESGHAAKEGTAAHEVLARCLETNPMPEPWEFMGTKVNVEGVEFEVDQRMVNALSLCFTHILGNMAEAEQFGEVIKFIEVSMKHSRHDLMYGTTDCGIVALDRKRRKVRVWVNDLKYGAGITVEPTSPQIKYYAELLVDRLIQEGIIDSHDDVERVVLTIMQPRIPHPEGLIRSIEMTGAELESWYLHELVPAMRETENPDAVLEMGEWCTFCPVKSHCPAMAQAVLDLSNLTDPESMSGDQLGETLNKIKAIVKLGERIEQIAFDRAMKGVRIKGFKLVKKKANRQWRDAINVDGEMVPVEEYLKSKFGEAAYTKPVLLTPPQIEKLPGGKTFVTQCAFTPTNTGLTLVPLSDNRVEAKSLMDIVDEAEYQRNDL
jgi:hypothetical protein